MDTKICFKCELSKPISDYYFHKGMADGHLNKCKDCTKNDVKERYNKLADNIEYVEKERARGREKYHRLGYNGKRTNRYDKVKNAKRYLKARGIYTTGKEIHHWNYNFANDVFLLSPRAHKLVHKYITFDEETKCFKYNGLLLKSKKHHYAMIKKVFSVNNVLYEIESIDL